MKSLKYALMTGILLFTATSVSAHTKCRINLGFGNWTEGCPHFHTPSSAGTESSLPMMTDTYLRFGITNNTTNEINFRINQDKYRLRPGEKRDFKYRDCYGTNTSNIQCYDILISFDFSYSEGYQEKQYNLKPKTSFHFETVGDGIELYND
ncbi:hypothetical protein VU06_01220 [Desulfobulbus sp. F3]|nr:hypothetical protein [Desulfobulbus sp. F3]